MFDFVNSGDTRLDLILGGGFPLGRMVHVVGDASTGKTQLAIELCANFARQYPNGLIRYCDAEAAFDVEYAARLGLPLDMIRFVEPSNQMAITLEDFDRHLNALIQELRKKPDKERGPAIFILDSLDALPTEKEFNLDNIEDHTGYGTEKAKLLGEIFRKTMQPLEALNVLLFVISQTRDNISVTYGSKKIFSGGNAPKFYASQRLLLTHLGRLKKQVNKKEYPYGIKAKVKVEKNKCGPPFRESEYIIVFDYGLDDVTGNLEWLAIDPKTLERLPAELRPAPPEKVEKPAKNSKGKKVAHVPTTPEEKKKAKDAAESGKALTISSIKKCLDQFDKTKRKELERAIAQLVRDVYMEDQQVIRDSQPVGKYEE